MLRRAHQTCSLAVALVLVAVSGCECVEPLSAVPPPPVTRDDDDDDDDDVDVGAIEGVLCNAHVGDVVRGATIQVLVPGGEPRATLTDDDGHFLLDDVPAGDQVLQAVAPTFHKTEPVTVVAGGVVTVDIGGACGIPAPLSFGAVEGRVCSPDGGTWLVDATAAIVPVGDDVAIADQTDVDGRYRLEQVPAGAQRLVIEKGSFRRELDVVIPANDTLVLADDECALDADELNIAVVRGSQFDHVENVLSSIGVDIARLDIYDGDWAEQLLSADERVRDYDILFLNCRAAEPVYLASPEMQQRLRDYVADGGSLHSSDQGYDLLEVTWPENIDFLGDDLLRAQADRGAIADVTATVTDSVLAAGLGRDTVTLHYALETWSTMIAVGADVDVYLRADSPLMDGTVLTDVPQIVGFDHGDGRVVYSSFHQEPGSHPDQVDVLRLLMFEL